MLVVIGVLLCASVAMVCLAMSSGISQQDEIEVKRGKGGLQ